MQIFTIFVKFDIIRYVVVCIASAVVDSYYVFIDVLIIVHHTVLIVMGMAKSAGRNGGSFSCCSHIPVLSLSSNSGGTRR